MSAGLCLWFTGLSGAGKTTLSRAVELQMRALGHSVRVLDGDELRRSINRDLGFSRAGRDENVARIAALARGLVRDRHTVLVAAISPYREARAQARATIETVGRFLEVHVDAPLEVCIRRDPKGLYTRALAGQLSGFTGVDDPYEPPLAPDVLCNTALEDAATCAAKALAAAHASLHERTQSTVQPTSAASE